MSYITKIASGYSTKYLGGFSTRGLEVGIDHLSGLKASDPAAYARHRGHLAQLQQAHASRVAAKAAQPGAGGAGSLLLGAGMLGAAGYGAHRLYRHMTRPED